MITIISKTADVSLFGKDNIATLLRNLCYGFLYYAKNPKLQKQWIEHNSRMDNITMIIAITKSASEPKEYTLNILRNKTEFDKNAYEIAINIFKPYSREKLLLSAENIDIELRDKNISIYFEG